MRRIDILYVDTSLIDNQWHHREISLAPFDQGLDKRLNQGHLTYGVEIQVFNIRERQANRILQAHHAQLMLCT